MTNEELQEYARNAHAQAMGAQSILMALMIALERNGVGKAILKEAFDLAADTYVTASYSSNETLKAESTRILQVIDHMRQTVIDKN